MDNPDSNNAPPSDPHSLCHRPTPRRIALDLVVFSSYPPPVHSIFPYPAASTSLFIIFYTAPVYIPLSFIVTYPFWAALRSVPSRRALPTTFFLLPLFHHPCSLQPSRSSCFLYLSFFISYASSLRQLAHSPLRTAMPAML